MSDPADHQQAKMKLHPILLLLLAYLIVVTAIMLWGCGVIALG